MIDKAKDGILMSEMAKELGADVKNAWTSFVVSHSVVTRKIDKRLAEAGLPSLDVYDVLLTLENADNGRLRMSALAEQVMLSRSGITRLVDRLEKEGLLKRHDCPSDRRATYAVITEKGLALRRKMWPTFRAGIAEYFGAFLSDEESRTLSAAFRRMAGTSPAVSDCVDS
jgi:DNA-binding MarR family transcriptional regulator